MTGRRFTLRAGYWSVLLLMVVGLLLGLNESVQAGGAASNTYGTIASAGGTLSAGVANQTVATVPVTLGSGGVAVTSYTVVLGGTITAGQVTEVTVTGGGTWTLSGFFGSGSTVVCTGASVKPGATLSIQVTLAAGTAGKTVSVQLQADSIGSATLPTGVSTALSITDPPVHNLTAFTNNAPSTANPDATTKYLFATITSAAANGGTDVTDWSLTVNDNGTTLTPSAVTVYVEYGGTQVGSGSPVAMGTPFTIATAGTQNGDSDWTFKVMLAGAADTKSIQLSINSATGGTNAGAALPKTAPASGFVSITTATGLTCSDCHTNPPTDGTRNATTGSVAGDHAKHVTTYGYTCNVCHVDSTSYTSRHRNSNIQVISPIGALLNARYDKNNNHVVDATDTSWAQTPSPTLGKCENTACHGGTNAATLYGGPTGVGPTWGTSTSGTCTFCHNKAKTDSGVNADAYPTTASPFRSTTAVGAHAQHLTGTSGLISGGVLCTDCHTVPGTVGAAGHVTNYAAPADLTFSAKASLNSTTASYGSGTCTVYCHGTNMPAGDTSGTNEVNTSWTASWTNYPTGCTAACHGLPPTAGTSASAHSGKTFPTSCITCHSDTVTSTANPPGINTTYHINGTVEASGCNGCHGGDNATVGNVNFWPGGSLTAYPKRAGEHNIHIQRLATKLGYPFTNAMTDQQQLTMCAYCHVYTATPGETGHNDDVEPATVGSFNSLWSALDATPYPTTADDGAYTPGTAGGAGSNGVCSNVDCHDNYPTATTVTSYDWYDASTSTCIMCHTKATSGNQPSSGLHYGTTAPMVTGKWHDNTLNGVTTDCLPCHTMPAYAQAGTHINGQFTGNGLNTATDKVYMGLLSAYTATSDGVGTCVGSPTGNAGCHDGAGDAGTWARKWNSGVSYLATGAECAGCHGGFTGSTSWNTGVLNHAADASWLDGDTTGNEIANNHGTDDNTIASRATKCQKCHVYADTVNSTYKNNASPGSIGWVGNASNTSTHHGDGNLDFDNNRGYTLAAGCTSSCHTDNAGHKPTATSGWTLQNISGAPALSCSDCHSGITAHLKLVKGGADVACTQCHPGGTYAPTAHSLNSKTDIKLIANNTTVGINYSQDGLAGIALGGDSTLSRGSSEPDICWNCHDQNANGSLADAGDVSEWGLNTGGTYNYGTYNKKSWFDTGGTWSSANFTYKNGSLTTKPGAQARVSSHDTGSTVGTTKEAVGSVVCSYCHDVHDRNLATGDATSGKPFLRGTWRASGYREDGAPINGNVWTTGSSVYHTGSTTTTTVPRSSSGENGYGGYQIDQNNGSPNATYAYTTNDTLCALCHTEAAITTAWIGHKNAVKGFTNDTTVATRNIMGNAKQARGTTFTDRYNPGMAYQGVTNYYDAKGWMGGFREDVVGNNQGMTQPLVNGQAKGYLAASYQWGTQGTGLTNIDVTGTSVNADYHSFSCSKCHTPHASRLPRLMITNCLDVKNNTWDNNTTFANDAQWANWPNLTPASGQPGYKQFAYAKTAQNCHRYVDQNSNRTYDAATPFESAGWNTATPW